jgi:hypothetical protein
MRWIHKPSYVKHLNVWLEKGLVSLPGEYSFSEEFSVVQFHLFCSAELLLAVVFKFWREWCIALLLHGFPCKDQWTHESIGRLWRVKPKRDVNGLRGRLKLWFLVSVDAFEPSGKGVLTIQLFSSRRWQLKNRYHAWGVIKLYKSAMLLPRGKLCRVNPMSARSMK